MPLCGAGAAGGTALRGGQRARSRVRQRPRCGAVRWAGAGPGRSAALRAGAVEG